MLRVPAPYLAVLVIATLISAVGYSTDRINAAGVYGIMTVGLLIAGIGAVRWEQRHPHRD
jgi:hypothetical protein